MKFLTSIEVFRLCTLCSVYIFGNGEASFSKDSRRACDTSTGAKGECTKLSECKPFYARLDGRPFFGVGTNFDSICSRGPPGDEVCCPLDIAIGHNSQEAAESQRNDGIPRRDRLMRPPHCGYASADADHRIVGGIVAEAGAWPWIAAIAIRFGDKNEAMEWVCGGSLITTKHIVTAAHCMEYEETPYFVRLGAIDLESVNNRTNPTDIAVKNWTIHPSYNDVTKENDIAVLELERGINFSDAIGPVCLPLDADVRNRNYVGHYPFVIGWGTTAYGGPSSAVLREVQVPVVSTDECKKAFEKKNNTIVDDRILCAGYSTGGKDACQGDSGGPLMYPKRTTFYLIGIVSNGYRCAKAGYPGLYTRITYFLDFIVSLIK